MGCSARREALWILVSSAQGHYGPPCALAFHTFTVSCVGVFLPCYVNGAISCCFRLVFKTTTTSDGEALPWFVALCSSFHMLSPAVIRPEQAIYWARIDEGVDVSPTAFHARPGFGCRTSFVPCLAGQVGSEGLGDHS